GLKRHRQYIALLDAAIGRFREGMAAGVVDTKLTIRNVIAQLDELTAQTTEESPFYQPVLDFPKTVPAADRARLTAAYRNVIVIGINPAEARLRDFLRTDYLPVAREAIGLGSMK